MKQLILLIFVLIHLAACKNSGEIPTYSTEPYSEATPTILNEESIFNARVHLAEHLGIDPGEIIEKGIKVVDWPDASLGCPQPGIMYTQVITPGYKIVFEANGKEYTYHTDMHGYVVLCDGDS